MSQNVTGPRPAPVQSVASLLFSAVLATGVSWFAASVSSASWDPPPAPVSDGVCAEACGIAACIAFDPGEEAQACIADLGDLSRAGPDPSCVQQCARGGAPPEVAQWQRSPLATMGTH